VLTKTEFDILYLLMNNAGKVYSRRDISKYVWGKEEISFPRTIDVHICNIRKKIGKVGNQHVIVVHKKVGYKYNETAFFNSNVFSSSVKEQTDALQQK